MSSSTDVCLPSHLLVELTSLDELSFPTSSSARLKYTCMCGSPHFLAVGSSSGTVYLFSRYAARYRKSLNSVPVQVIANKEGSVEQISTSPNECHMAVATSRGHVTVFSVSGTSPSQVLQSSLHVGSQVTSLCWDHDCSHLYAADSGGRVSCSRVGSRNLFRSASELLLQLDSAVIQMDFSSRCLLASTLTRCYLYHTIKTTCVQVGRKPRSGPFGACFFVTEDNDRPLIFAARPNGRLWEVDSEGVVYSTHQFSHLTQVPYMPCVTFRNDFDPVVESPAPTVVQFSKVHVLKQSSDQFLLTVADGKLFVLEPKKARVVLVCEYAKDSLEYSICGSDLFILNQIDGSLKKFSLFSVAKAVEKLHWRECMLQAAQLMAIYQPAMKTIPWKPDLITSVKRHMEEVFEIESDSELLSRLSALLHASKTQQFLEQQSAAAKTTAVRLASGVHRVVRIMENSGYDDDFTFRAPSPLRIKQRCRSSPDIDLDSEIVSVRMSYNKRHSMPLSSPTQLTVDLPWVDTNQDSLRTLLGAPSTGRAVTFDEIAVRDSLRIDDAKLPQIPSLDTEDDNNPLLDSFEGRMLRTLEQGGKKVMNKVVSVTSKKPEDPPSKSRHRLKPNIAYPVEMDFVGNVEPLTPMPEAPVVERKVPRKRRIKVQTKSYKQNGNVNMSHSDELNNTTAYVLEKPISSSDSADQGMNRNNGNDDFTDELLKMHLERQDTPLSENGEPDSGTSTARPASDEICEELDEATGSDKCEKCGLHKSWWLVLKLGRFLPSVPISPDDYPEGGVPASLRQWLELLTLWFRFKSDPPPDTRKLCFSCRQLLDDLSSPQDSNFAVEKVPKSPAGKVPKEWFEERRLAPIFTDKIPSEKVKKVADLKDKSEADNDSDSLMAYSTYFNPIYESSELTNGEKNVPDACWNWLMFAPLDSLLVCMSFVLGAETLLDALTIELMFLHPHLDAQVWSALAARVCAQKNSKLPPQMVIDSLFRDVLTMGRRAVSPTRIQYSSSGNQPTNSFAVDVSMYCPCCTLPLSSRVSEAGIVVFDCGHSFHQVCLSNRSSSELNSPLNCFKCTLSSGIAMVEIK